MAMGRGTLAAVAFGLVCTGAFGGGGAAGKQQARLQGTWKVLKMQQDGRPAPADEVQKTRLVVAGDKLTVTVEGTPDEVATFTLDPSQKPAAIDIRPAKEKKVVRGIYKFEKDQLLICFAKDGKERPKEFASSQDARTTLVVLDRVKK
jgi:uncharacterized protein (TIGR03067 family)